MAVNLVLNFLFKQHRDELYTRAFFMRLFNKDFQFMMASTNLGKILLGVTVVDFSLGSSVPYISNVRPLRPADGEPGAGDSLELVFDLHYTCAGRGRGESRG